jgi:hypothetical protein
MNVLVTKATSSYWYEIRTFNTIDDIQKFIKECGYSIVIGINRLTDNEDFDYWDDMNPADIPIIKKCPLHITIYNDYIE